MWKFLATHETQDRCANQDERCADEDRDWIQGNPCDVGKQPHNKRVKDCLEHGLWRCRLTRIRSATAVEGERELQWTCFHKVKRGGTPTSGWLHRLVRSYRVFHHRSSRMKSLVRHIVDKPRCRNRGDETFRAALRNHRTLGDSWRLLRSRSERGRIRGS